MRFDWKQSVTKGVLASLLPLLTGCTSTASAPVKQRVGGTMIYNQESNQMDSERAGRVAVVLRVKYVKLIGGNKFTWEEVAVVNVLKNSSTRKFDGNLEIAHYDSEPGIPEQGESTVYLEPFAEGDESRWKLLNGTAKDGVSHAK